MTEADQIRQRRIYRAAAAEALQALCENDDDDRLASVSWDTLDSMPHWCLQSPKERAELQMIAGALFISPLLKQCIDGKKLKAVRDLLSQPVLDAILDTDCVDSIPLQLADDDDITDMLGASGASVLLGTLTDDLIKQIYQNQFAVQAGDLSVATAEPIYLVAAGIQNDLAVAVPVSA